MNNEYNELEIKISLGLLNELRRSAWESGYADGYVAGEEAERVLGGCNYRHSGRVDYGWITRDRSDVVILENAK